MSAKECLLSLECRLSFLLSMLAALHEGHRGHITVESNRGLPRQNRFTIPMASRYSLSLRLLSHRKFDRFSITVSRAPSSDVLARLFSASA